MFRIDSLLSARLFLAPQVVGNRIYFISNLSGRLSLYAMDAGGSIPEPLLPPNIAMQNPHLLEESESFFVFPKLGKILLMLDRDGDENYQPMLIPLEGGFPEPIFGLENYRVTLLACYPEQNLVYLSAGSRSEAVYENFRGNLETGELFKISASPWGMTPDAISADHRKAILVDGYSLGDHVLYFWEQGQPQPRLLSGLPIEQRAPGQTVPLIGYQGGHFTPGERGLLMITALFADHYGLGYLALTEPSEIQPVAITGTLHQGQGELTGLRHLSGERLLLTYNIDGCSWLYEGWFDEAQLTLRLDTVICGQGVLSNGMLELVHYDKDGDRYALSFSSATSPTQIYTVEGRKRQKVVQHTRERILGISTDLLAPGEDASFTSFDGLRISARLYLPSAKLGYSGPRPLVYYIHGGPQSQERPDFAWFSMPLIQFLTLNGFAVFVPNVRGSTGYGLSYTKHVDRDWGGNDRLDHVHAMTQVLPNDKRLDVHQAGVVGRSYGGYMSLTQAGRHPELWKAAVDMFGPYDLLTFSERIPETWKPYFIVALGDPAKPEERDFLIERSPRTHLIQLACPLLVIQGKNDPRVVEQELRDLVANLRSSGKNVEYLMFENEGHDVLKHENRVTCYNAITDFFKSISNHESSTANPGDLAQLISAQNKRFLLRLEAGGELHTHRGILKHDDLIGLPWGTRVLSHLGSPFTLLQPSLLDILQETKRNTQIMYGKDIGFVLMMMDIHPGKHVVEAGTGSGALTTALAYMVGPQGRITTYEAREPMQKLAIKNITRLGLADRVTFKLRDIAGGFDETGVDALFLDVPNPYDYMAQVRAALKPGGFFGTLLPTTNQVQMLLMELRRERFAFVEVCEIMLRYYKPVPARLRPTDRMVAHTGYLIFGRPVAEGVLEDEEDVRKAPAAVDETDTIEPEPVGSEPAPENV